MEINIKHYKDLLEADSLKLEMELKTIGRKNPEKSGDWEATEQMDIDQADETEVADSIEEYENNGSILNQLETQLSNVKNALVKIENGTFGKCSVCDKDIEKDRLDANPSAITCKIHM